MIGSLHWTLIAILMLCAGCAALNIVQMAVTGTMRATGLLVCGFWAMQQVWWLSAGSDSLPLMLACDGLLVAFLLHRRAANDWSDWLILAIAPATMACYLQAELTGQTILNWWLNWSLVAVQMLLGFPRNKHQTCLPTYTHGPLRRKSHGGA